MGKRKRSTKSKAEGDNEHSSQISDNEAVENSDEQSTSKGKKPADNSKVQNSTDSEKDEVENVPPKKKRSSKVSEKNGDARDSENEQESGEQNSRRLRRSFSKKSPESVKSKKTPRKAKTDSKEEYEVEAIIGKRKRKGRDEFLVKWKDYGDDNNTWEPKSNLKNCLQILKNYIDKDGK